MDIAGRGAERAFHPGAKNTLGKPGNILVLPGISYSYSTRLSFSTQFAFMHGGIPGRSLDVFENKDYVAFKVRYTL